MDVIRLAGNQWIESTYSEINQNGIWLQATVIKHFWKEIGLLCASQSAHLSVPLPPQTKAASTRTSKLENWVKYHFGIIF